VTSDVGPAILMRTSTDPGSEAVPAALTVAPQCVLASCGQSREVEGPLLGP